ncbi:MAG TPA: tRNA epoxyqueuosine(34) reductase QueG [Kofleriaceae bacterium]|nr:tRNA epoxyqueuosine(34) reductase QueG [Kofleriaceae bacterium]
MSVPDESATQLRDLVVESAKRHGFHRVGIVPVEPSRRADVYRDWLAAGRHGEMTYLATDEHVAGRTDARALLAGARTVIVVALAYGKDAPPPPPPSSSDGTVAVRGLIARYARGTDYHMVVRDRLQLVAAELVAAAGRPVATRVCVDSAPVAERELAERAGLGFSAKNTMVIAPGLGSFVVLGELLVDVDLAATPAPTRDKGCGQCRACLDACPTGAFVDAYVLDARRCISYLTIEHDGAIPLELRSKVGAMIFGCDVCQEVCPYNAAAPDRHAPAAELTPRDADHARPDLVALAAAGANQLRQFVKRTALRRVDRRRLLRNVAVALGNSGETRAAPAAIALLAHPESLVRGHAAWAIGELAARAAVDTATAAAAIERALSTETDTAARDELTAAAARVATFAAATARA